jgi:dolichol kinase
MGLGLGLVLAEDWPGAVGISYKSAGVSAEEGINEIIRTYQKKKEIIRTYLYLYLYLYLVLLFFFLVL